MSYIQEEDRKAGERLCYKESIDEISVKEVLRKERIAADAHFEASSSRGEGFEAEAMRGEDNAYWATADGITTGNVSLKWDTLITAKYVVIEEHISLGQRVREFSIEAREGGKWVEVAKGTTVGYKRILALDGTVSTNELRIRFLDARGPLTIARIAVY